MRNYVIRRLLWFPVMLVGVSFMLFYLLSARPGDAAILAIGVNGGSCTECVENMRTRLGLDKPFIVQYLNWGKDAARGDLGNSLQTNKPIMGEMRQRLPNTLEIAFISTLLTLLIGIPAGVISAVKPGRPIDYTLRVLTIGGLSVPGFWLATLLITLPAIWWGWTPLAKFVKFQDDPLGNLRVVFWPALVLAVASAAYVARIVRSGMVEMLYSDHVRTARAKGLGENAVMIRHVLRTSLVTLITVIGVQLAGILGGSVIMEQIFGVPGIGVMGLQATFAQDYHTVLAVTVIFFSAFMTIQLLVDVAYAYVDPRIRYQE